MNSPHTHLLSSMASVTATAAAAAAAAAAASGRNENVMGDPVQANPSNPNVVLGNPQVEPSRPPVYLHQLFRQRQRGDGFFLSRQDQILLYRLTAPALAFFLVMACVFLMLWLLLRPHPPHLQIASVTVSPLSTSNTNVSATCNVSILLTNPNKKITAFYDNFEVLLQYQRHQVLLSDVQVPPFAQPGKNDTFVHTHLQINNANVGKDVVKSLKEDLGHGSVSFGVKIVALVRLESKQWRGQSQRMKFYCRDVILGFSINNGSGDLLDPFKECQIALI